MYNRIKSTAAATGAAGATGAAAAVDELGERGSLDGADDVDVDVEVEVDVDVVVEEVATQKPHFLDYDAVPPPDFEENFDRILSFRRCNNATAHATDGELRKLDKKYERDGEISDYELAASGYTKKEFTQDDNTLHMSSLGVVSGRKQTYSRPKHFLDENPIPPDYMLEHELREHRSLDRNFERQHEQHEQQKCIASPPISLAGSTGRKNSLERGASVTHSARERYREPSYTLSRFLDSDAQLIGSPLSMPSTQHHMLKSAAWTESFDSRYNSLQMSTSHTTMKDMDTLGNKVECVYSLLSMLGSHDPLEMSKKFLELSRTPETCVTLRRSGCIPLLVQMMHAEGEENVCKFAGMALHNVVHSNPDEKTGRRETKVLRLLDQIMDYCSFLKTLLQSGGEAIADDSDRHPLAAMSSLMKVSFDEEHRHAMCELGALQAIPNLVHLDHAVHGPKPEDQCCNSLRRYALMALTNLTFGDENNKALLCSQKLFMEALVAQLESAPDDLLQVTASVLRNLSWRADSNMKAVLNEIGTVTALARAAMKNKNENTLKAILSALWNLSAHCSTNKAEFCAVDGALAFLVDMLTYEGPSKTLKIIENAGGILRNVSSHIAVREHYRQILRERKCLSILLQQLKSESLTVVSNSCGTLWNLSARCPEDQKFLWDNGAVPMLRSLINSKHAMISEGSSSALKNLLNFRPSIQNQNPLDPIARSMGLKKLPTLNARKQKALEQELGAKEHAETCDNLDNRSLGLVVKEHGKSTTPTNFDSSSSRRYATTLSTAIIATSSSAAATTTTRLTRSAMLKKSESRDSVFSVKSDSVYENLMRSHSASNDNRSSNNTTQKLQSYTVSVHAVAARRRAAPFTLETDVEQPIDYSAKYNNEHSGNVKVAGIGIESENEIGDGAVAGGAVAAVTDSNYATYQETDLDQPTDFSLRYAENQIESDVDISPPETAGVEHRVAANKMNATAAGEHLKPAGNNGNEIILILEDSVKCYQTEDTPYVISNAASVTDLRQTKAEASINVETVKPVQTKKYQRTVPHQTAHTAYGSGSYTPEKPVNYCEEGTPGYFSRYESLSSLDDSPPQQSTQPTSVALDEQQHKKADASTTKPISITNATGTKVGNDNADTTTTVNAHSNNNSNKSDAMSHKATTNDMQLATSSAHGTNLNSAQETPLMFSRHSSMDSLVEEDVGPCDDKSSVVSEFSRLASGIISPSELPDSPTQSMPQSPRRNSTNEQGNNFLGTREAAVGHDEPKRVLRSVFEDNLNTFNVENTPAQFSCATSLSNLSILDDEQGITRENQSPQQQQQATTRTLGKTTGESVAASLLQVIGISEGEEEEEAGANNDDFLLASCINMGMNRPNAKSDKKTKNKHNNNVQLPTDEPKQYYTEDTPALLSKVGSNTNLSAISICSSNNEPRDDNNENTKNAHSLANQQLHDDISSNASESGAAAGDSSFDLLQQCIRVGMQKPQTQMQNTTKAKAQIKNAPTPMDPIAMMRRGGALLPPYLPVADESNKYLVEDSPCNFSVMSELSNLTVGSSLVGPAVQLKEQNNGAYEGNKRLEVGAPVSNNIEAPNLHVPQDEARRELQWHDDSLSSLSIDSEDDTNLLSQAIAAGCNRPKSNLGFSTTSFTSKRSSSLSASQPLSINTATSSSSLNSRSTTTRAFNRKSHEQQMQRDSRHNNGNESYSSVDSSDSNDNQSKSLLELCILTGMHKSRDQHKSRKQQQQLQQQQQQLPQQHLQQQQQQLFNGRNKNSNIVVATSTQSNPNLKHYDMSGVGGSHQKQYTQTNRHLLERERKDEKLLMECISTGISKKINANGSATGGGNASGISDNASRSNRGGGGGGELMFAANAVPKNVQATSAAALAPFHQLAATTSPSVKRTAAPDVETNNSETPTYNRATSWCNENAIAIVNVNASEIEIERISNNNQQHINSNSLCNISPDDIINEVRKMPMPLTTTTLECCAVNHQNHANAIETLTNDTGFDEPQTHSDGNDSMINDNVTSDESNQSFIMETTVSLDTTQRPVAIAAAADKHKDPDLMLKSVERLTLEFVTSAEQLRTNGSSESNTTNDSQKRLGSISVGGNSSNNTWNEDTCPNDVSFPSVSISAPVIVSLKYDDDDEDDDDDDDEQATEADHKELHDFAEITPTNEAQPPPSIDYTEIADNDLYGHINTQPNSLETETETDTLVREDIETFYTTNTNSSGSSGINFKLGGEVQTAATAANSQLYFQNSAMTNSNIIAFEARVLAEHLQQDDNVSVDERTDCYSVSSLDLDNVRPPSGMESLNISGYYQDVSQGLMSQPHSLPVRSLSNQSNHNGHHMPQSPQFLYAKSPKFPRKSLPPGLVARRALGQLPGHLAGSAESVNSSCNLLDNIKPPSLMDELLDSMISVASIQSEVAECESMATTVSLSNYHTAAPGAITDAANELDENTITLLSCYDAHTLPHDDDADVSVNSGTPLPSDGDYSSAESTPLKSQSATPTKRTLTPKQKRKMSKDRFKTYTIDPSDVLLTVEQRQKLEDAQKDETLQIEIIETTTTTASAIATATETTTRSSISRRRTSQDRYKTQTIVYASSSLEQMQENEIGLTTGDDEVAYGPSSLTSTDDCPSDDVSSIRGMTRKFKFISTTTMQNAEALPQVDVNDVVSLEHEQNSETESCHGQFSEPENDTYDNDVAFNRAPGNDLDATAEVVARPRITKPNENVAKEEQQQQQVQQDEEQTAAKNKAIRGRKKPAYISPYSMQSQRNTAASSRLASNRQLKTNVSKTTTTTSPHKTNSKKPATEAPILERQGTFVKDEPTVTTAQVPIVETEMAGPASSNTTPQTSPSKRTSKLPTKQRAIQPAVCKTARKLPLTTTASAATTTTTGFKSKFKRAGSLNTTTAVTKTAVKTTSLAPQRSNSNTTLRVTGSAVRMAVLSTRVSATTPPSRSNSNLGGVSGAATAAAAASKINAAQSRIASIWKRVDEARTVQQKQKLTTGIATSKPRTSHATRTTTASTAVKQPKQQQQQQTLVRSTTFDNLPQQTLETTTATTNGLSPAHHNVPTTQNATVKADANVPLLPSATKILGARGMHNSINNNRTQIAVRK